MPFPIGGPFEQRLYLQPFSRYCALSVLGSRVWPFKVTWRHRWRYHSVALVPFPTGCPLEPSLYIQRFPRYSTSNATLWLTWPWPLNKGQGHSFWY